jgi:hypothetical protein
LHSCFQIIQKIINETIHSSIPDAIQRWCSKTNARFARNCISCANQSFQCHGYLSFEVETAVFK